MGMGNGWKQKSITVPTKIVDAAAMATWLQSVALPNSYCVVMRDNWDQKASENGTLLVANIDDGNMGAYIRWYSGQYNGGSQWSSNYDLSADDGDKYTMYYKEKAN